MASTVIMKIMSLQSSFTSSENEISQFVMKNQDTVITNTITTLAKKIGTSEASINRFCKKIGFKGFNSFKIALAQSQFQDESLGINDPTKESNTLDSLSYDYRQIISHTSAMIDLEALATCAEYMTSTNRIHIFSAINTESVAREFSFKLKLVGIDADVHCDSIDIQLCLSSLSEDDLLIAIVPSILNKDIYPALTSAKEKNAKVVLISSTDSTKFNDIIDVKFITPDRLISKYSNSISNTLMYLFVCDSIFETLLRNDKTLRQKKLNSESIINSNQSIDSYYMNF
ncbi:MurR/RpiR family transcriptional regulator [Breznakia pachnodae]|uniref:DNA-binding MurR/RpiR family transcriptional regulator n=1 Tax=Breznakia pachnodae TaxID=265178 RepID=A0ABU0E0Z9_9FIRM|nr:MurR/RpiR family transcriptional regulator [Breznakia pachnodae]MDQ0360398.1 DNA-binding MurR/RpiR family transcriptional regulator [Breznakia pachnodae]